MNWAPCMSHDVVADRAVRVVPIFRRAPKAGRAVSASSHSKRVVSEPRGGAADPDQHGEGNGSIRHENNLFEDSSG